VTPQSILKLLGLISSLLQVIGTFLMANALLNVTEGAGGLLLSALFRGRKVKDHEALSNQLSKENKVKSLQGLAVLGLGFLLDFGCKLYEMLE
jgi:hypothetical protein